MTKIGESVFKCCESLFSRLTFVYYLANLSDWEKVKIGPYNKSLLDADLHTHDHM